MEIDMNYIQKPTETALQYAMDEIHGDGTYMVYTSVDGAGYDIHNSEGDWIETLETSIEVEYSYLN
tara:strand:- start:316 stop:513 length:198 start_codon:yes stop_codon:yes gene_type:complete